MNLSYIIKKPIISEKSLSEASLNRFSFVVARSASKDQIKEAIQTVYSVDVVKVRTTKITPKPYRAGKKRQVKLSAPGKKAIVQLKKGQKIDLFDVQEGKK